MRIRWSQKSAVPLLLLAVLYAAGALQLAHSYSSCDLSLPERVASGLERAESGWSWLVQASSRLRLGSWLGNSWAPGSIGWRAASNPSPKSPLVVQAAASVEAFNAYGPQVEPLESDVRVADCATRPLLVLARPEVVIVTAEFPRLPASEAGLADLPDRPEAAPADQIIRTGWCNKPLLLDPSTI